MYQAKPTTLKLLFMLWYGCLSHAFAVEQPAESIEWTEDGRIQYLETITVDKLPKGRLDAPSLLAHYNKRVKELGQEKNLLVVFQSPPDVLTNDFLWRDILTPGYLYGMGLLEPLKITSEDNLREQLERINLRQFLWLICRAYNMEITYSKIDITVGYGFFSHNVISPDPAEKEGEAGGGPIGKGSDL